MQTSLLLTGQADEAAEVGLFQEQVEPARAVYHSPQLERAVCLCQEDYPGKPGHDLLPEPQRPVS